MIRQAPRSQSAGVTLTEILIGIMIMGIGMLSLATLFPVGLVRIRDATRNTRSALLAPTAVGEVEARNLLDKKTFRFSWYQAYDLWVQDTPLDATNPLNGGVYRGFGEYGPAVPYVPGPGLPVAYDPLWWSMVHQQNNVNAPDNPAFVNAAINPTRFGVGLASGLRNDPVGGGPPSAHGLQRITNFLPWLPTRTWDFTYPTSAYPNVLDVPGLIFASQDDIVFQKEAVVGGTQGGGTLAGTGSPLVPDMSATGQVMNDWNFTWMITGQQTDASDGTVFDGSVVIFHNRPFALDQNGPAGERVIEAIFGFSTVIDGSLPPYDYSRGDDRIVLLRWPQTQPDPNIVVGSWIADVTYERSLARSNTKFGNQLYPGQRCYWYQIAKVGRVEPELAIGTRRMIVSLASPVRAKTLMQANGDAVFVNAALISPYVVNVFPKVFYSR